MVTTEAPRRRPGDAARGCLDLVANVFMLALVVVLLGGTALCWVAYLLPDEEPPIEQQGPAPKRIAPGT